MIVAYPSTDVAVARRSASPTLPPQLNGIFGAAPPRRHHHGHAARCPAHRAACRNARATVAGVLGSNATFGNIGGKGWEWVALGYLPGGLWLLQQRIITWHVPTAFLADAAG
jgi:electron transport complex protein RnfD